MGASTPAVASDEPALQGVLAAVRTAPVATSLPYFARDWPGGSIQFLTGRNSAAAASEAMSQVGSGGGVGDTESAIGHMQQKA